MIHRVFAFAAALISTSTLANDKTIFGLHEQVQLGGIDIELPAKLDTGADTASLSARNIELFTRDGDDWVRFELGLNSDARAAEQARGHRQTVIEKPVVRISKIKRRADDRHTHTQRHYTTRPVIEMDVCVGAEVQRIEMNLTDRSRFKYPMLIGARALREFNAAVDPAATFAAGSPRCG
jgi:hypothetical protein